MVNARRKHAWSSKLGLMGICLALWGAGCGSEAEKPSEDERDGSADGADGSAADGDAGDGTPAAEDGSSDGIDAGVGEDGSAEDGSAEDGSADDGDAGDGTGDGADAPEVPEVPFEGNGVTGAVNGTVITYTTNVQALPAGGDPLFLNLIAYSPNFSGQWWVNVPKAIGRYSCGEQGADVRLVDSSGQGPYGIGANGGSCTIEVAVSEANHWVGSFEAELLTTNSEFLHVTEGVFRYQTP